jgi:adenosylcobinamide kinase/adenosylcobinamide-phosphate guanylyltransferase
MTADKRCSGVVLVTGGARSGKSAFVLREAVQAGGRRAFLATAQETDEEMRQRIERHRRDRGAGWDVHEEPIGIAALIEELRPRYDVVVVDCLTLWLANVIQSGMDETEEIGKLLDVLRRTVGQAGSAKVFFVSNEVGMGIVPLHETARRFRDAAGFLNQRIADLSDEVFMTVAGIPVRIKGG